MVLNPFRNYHRLPKAPPRGGRIPGLFTSSLLFTGGVIMASLFNENICMGERGETPEPRRMKRELSPDRMILNRNALARKFFQEDPRYAQLQALDEARGIDDWDSASEDEKARANKADGEYRALDKAIASDSNLRALQESPATLALAVSESSPQSTDLDSWNKNLEVGSPEYRAEQRELLERRLERLKKQLIIIEKALKEDVG